MPPGLTGSGEALLVIERSATARTMVVTVALRLLAGFESTSWASTVAALVIGPPSLGAVTVRVMVATAALLSVPPLQVAVLVVVLNPQLKLPPLALTAVMVAPSGWSVTWIWVAVLGPLLVTVSARLKLAPASTWAAPVLVIARSATARTEVVTVALVLLAGLESTSWALTVAALVTVPPSSGAFTVRVMVACSVLLSRPPPRVTLFPYTTLFRSKLPPLALTAVMVAPSGWSVTWIWVAVLGPL